MDKFVILKEIGSGSFGKVYVVELKGMGLQYVAKQIDLKRLNKRQKALAEKEIQVLSKLKHGNIVGYKEAYSDEHHLHIVMELCEMGDLHGRIQEMRLKNGSFSENQVIEYFVQICLALEYIHRQRILHRDVKTKNIFLTKGNVVKLGDFGVAKILEDSFELARTCIGSPFYISPEICENQPYDKKSDIWALGCVLYELATLRYAFTAKNMKTLLKKISDGECNPLPANVSVKIRYLIGRLLQPNPKDRPASSEILAMPFVEEYTRKVSLKPKAVVNVGRSKSGDDVRIKEGSNFRSKTSRAMLPISKSSINLSTSTNITDPGTKYKTSNTCKQRAKQVVSKLSFRRSDKQDFVTLNNEVDLSRENKISNLGGPKVKKLPKSDSLYYNMVEEDSKGTVRSKTAATMIRNIFKETPVQEEVFETSRKQFESRLIEPEVEKSEQTPPELTTAEQLQIEPSSRRQWQISTADKDELITFLNEVELIGSDSDITDATIVQGIIPGRHIRTISVDDMLSMGTTVLTNVELLQPEVLANETKRAQENSNNTVKASKKEDGEEVFGDLIDLDTLQNFLSDRTFVVSSERANCPGKETDFERLEKRRIKLENQLGLDKFKTIYKRLEKIFSQNHKCDSWAQQGAETYTIIDRDNLDVDLENDDCLQAVWRLVIDDYVFSQRL